MGPMTSYAAPMTSYAAPTTAYGGYAAAPQMSYVPPMTGYGQAPTHSPYLDATTITQQEKDATEALNGQATMQLKMIGHQYTTQVDMIKAECDRNINGDEPVPAAARPGHPGPGAAAEAAGDAARDGEAAARDGDLAAGGVHAVPGHAVQAADGDAAEDVDA